MYDQRRRRGRGRHVRDPQNERFLTPDAPIVSASPNPGTRPSKLSIPILHLVPGSLIQLSYNGPDGELFGSPCAALPLHNESFLRNYPDCMNDPGQVSKNREEDVQPEMHSKTDLEKYSKRRQDDCTDIADDVHLSLSGVGLSNLPKA